MSIFIHFEFVWMPPNFGHPIPPYENMMTQIRWQHYKGYPENEIRTLKWEYFDYDPITSQGYAKCRFISDGPLPEGWLKPGLFIELTSGGDRVMAIGKIVEERNPYIN